MRYRLTPRGYWTLITFGLIAWVTLVLTVSGCSTSNPCGM